MEFGKLPNVDKVDWSLPKDNETSLNFLQSLAKPHGLELAFGTPAWGHREWVGKIYPEKTKSSNYLYYYSRKFTCIEFNTSHYRIPTPEQTEKWISQTPDNFLFLPKVYQSISHSTQGLVDKSLLKEWFHFLENLGERKGPCFLQLPPHFDYSFKSNLFAFLQLWPAEFELALEFRHSSWFTDDGQVLPALTKYLQTRRIGLVITDVAGRRDVVHSSLSADYAMIRFIGNDLHPSDYSRATAWAERFSAWNQLGLKKIFLIVHEPDDINAPEMTTYFTDVLNQKCNTELKFALLPSKVDQTSLL